MRAISALIVAGLAVLLLHPIFTHSVLAYPSYRDASGHCSSCHPGFLNRGPLHDMHVGNNNMTGTCLLCHTSTGDIPQTWTSGATGGQGCRGCHGVDNGTALAWGAGLRQHHLVAGAPADGNGQFCADCHNDQFTPVPEGVAPVYYSRSDVNVKDPCDAATSIGEDYDGDGKGLDNDGDNLYELGDPDCFSTTSVPGSTIPARLVLTAPTPNPVTAAGAEIHYALPARSDIVVTLYDLAGRARIRASFPDQAEGWHRSRFVPRDDRGRSLAAGIYFLRVEADGETATARIVISR